MWSANFVPHMNYVSVCPTNGNGPTQGQRKTLTWVGIYYWTHDLRVRSPLLYRLSYKVRWEQVVGTEGVNVHGLLLSDLVAQSVEQRWSNPKVVGSILNSHPGQSFSLSLCGPIVWTHCVGQTLTWFIWGSTQLILLKYKCYTANVCKNVILPCTCACLSWLSIGLSQGRQRVRAPGG